jgi:hypothetical protein
MLLRNVIYRALPDLQRSDLSTISPHRHLYNGLLSLVMMIYSTWILINLATLQNPNTDCGYIYDYRKMIGYKGTTFFAYMQRKCKKMHFFIITKYVKVGKQILIFVLYAQKKRITALFLLVQTLRCSEGSGSRCFAV